MLSGEHSAGERNRVSLVIFHVTILGIKKTHQKRWVMKLN